MLFGRGPASWGRSSTATPGCDEPLAEALGLRGWAGSMPSEGYAIMIRVIERRKGFPFPLALLGIGCASTIVAHRPLSDAAVAEANESIPGSRASVVLAEEPEPVVEPDRAAQAAREACQSAPGQGNARLGETCADTRDCECGLTCPSGRCLGTSLKNRASPSPTAPKPLEAKEVKVGRDTSQWLELRSGTEDEWRQRTVPTAALKSISVRQRGWGALQGAGLGVLSGVVAGALVGTVWPLAQHSTGGCKEAPFVCPPGSTILGALLAAIPGAILGTSLGAAIGRRTTVEFDPP